MDQLHIAFNFWHFVINYSQLPLHITITSSLNTIRSRRIDQYGYGMSYWPNWYVGYWMFCWPWWLLDVLIHHVGMLVIGCSVGHDGYWMSYWQWWILDTLFIVVIGRFDKRKQKRLRTKLYEKTADLNFPIGTFHLYVTTFLLHLHYEHNY